MNTVVDYNKLRNGLVDEKIWSRDEVLQLLPYHISFKYEIANRNAESIFEYCWSVKHRWNLLMGGLHSDHHILAFAREEDAVMFALRCL